MARFGNSANFRESDGVVRADLRCSVILHEEAREKERALRAHSARRTQAGVPVLPAGFHLCAFLRYNET